MVGLRVRRRLSQLELRIIALVVQGFKNREIASQLGSTEQGIKNFRESTKRAEDFTKLVEASGGRVRELLWTVGAYDTVSVVEFPYDESGVAALLRQGSAGNIRTNTMRAFSAGEMESIVARSS